VGHKSPDWPKPMGKGRKPEISKRVQTQQPDRVRTKEVITTCGRSKFSVPLDTGASVATLPKEVMNPADITGVFIQTRCANGTSMPLEEARVWLSVGNMELSRRVGVGPSSLIGGTGLLLFNFKD